MTHNHHHQQHAVDHGVVPPALPTAPAAATPEPAAVKKPKRTKLEQLVDQRDAQAVTVEKLRERKKKHEAKGLELADKLEDEEKVLERLKIATETDATH